jgi:hypothetical protein
MRLTLQWVIHRFITTDLGWEWSEAKHLVDMVITAITIVAMAVPEGVDCEAFYSIFCSFVCFFFCVGLVVIFFYVSFSLFLIRN